ncbi:MAG: iron-sulfur cluster assembly accessory protein [Deltaproteobacteria bacterium]|nr:iron-sulfur cluster assembly accessory protein [Deltaproteobacteria bacterium]MBI3293489.1 iron-sulfur cluster assembly accessory protein [Deltaproteobacteria bacterium]
MIQLTENAVKQIKRIREDEKVAEAEGGLRIAVVGGGCSGLSYKLDFTKDTQPMDKVFEQDGVRIFIDPKSFLYVRGLTLDYQGGLNGTGFTFQNPNAAKSCGCGTSFAV